MHNKQILNFTQAVKYLSILNSQIAHFLSSLRDELQYCKTANLPIIGNPLHRLFNDTIRLNYASLLLRDNCLIYKDLIDEDVIIDSSLLLQLDGLVLHIKEVRQEYNMIYSRFNDQQVLEYSRCANL